MQSSFTLTEEGPESMPSSLRILLAAVDSFIRTSECRSSVGPQSSRGPGGTQWGGEAN